MEKPLSAVNWAVIHWFGKWLAFKKIPNNDEKWILQSLKIRLFRYARIKSKILGALE